MLVMIMLYLISCIMLLLLFSSSGEYHVTTIAGDGGYGYRDGEGSQAQFNGPQGVTIDNNNNIIVMDYGAHRVRMITGAIMR